jgi:hypothetical protein
MKTAELLAIKDGLSSLQRPRFRPGLLLEDEDLNAGVSYTQDMMRLLFRSLFGCGVICGLEVTGRLTCQRRKLEISVAGGLALDCAGNPIHLAQSERLTVDPDCKPMPPDLWVTVCYTEKCCRPRDVGCSADEEDSVVHTRSRDGFEIRVYGEQPECVCSCEAPKPKPANGRKGCCDDTDGGTVLKVDATATADGPATPRDVCECYRDHNEGRCACGCGCRCVLVGKIRTGYDDKGTRLEADTTDVAVSASSDLTRKIRPVLTGFLECLAVKEKEDGEEQNDKVELTAGAAPAPTPVSVPPAAPATPPAPAPPPPVIR